MATPALPELAIIEPTQSIWGTSLQTLGCPRCKQAFLVDSSLSSSTHCPNCAHDMLEPQPARMRPEPPEFVVPFEIKITGLSQQFTNFCNEVKFRPNDLNPALLENRVVRLFWPLWLVDCDLQGDWQAEVGFDYQVESSLSAFDGQQWKNKDVIETRIRWEKYLGQLNRHYDNISAPAWTVQSKVEKLIGKISPSKANPITESSLSALDRPAIVAIPDLPPESTWPSAKNQLNQAASEECRLATGGQHIRNFSIKADYKALHWTQILFPMFVTYYTDDNNGIHPVFVNGVTGGIGGARIASQRKGWIWGGTAAIVGIALLFIGLLGIIFGAIFPPAFALGILFLLLGIIGIIIAVSLIIWPWQWNQRQSKEIKAAQV